MAPQTIPRLDTQHEKKGSEEPQFFIKKSDRPAAKKILSVLEKKQNPPIIFSSVRDLVETNKIYPNGVVIIVIENKSDLLDLVQAQTKLRNEIKLGTIRSIAIPVIQNDRLLKVLRDNKVSETIDPSVAARALDFKLERHIKLIQNALSKMGVNQNKDRKHQQRTPTPSRKQAGAQTFSVKADAPLKSKADCWLIQRKEDARRVLGKWMIDMVGPGPLVGHWTPANLSHLLNPSDASDVSAELSHETLWQWTPRDKKLYDELVAAKGRWLATGKKPDFREGKWSFVAATPRLFFVPRSGNVEKIRIRFYLDGISTLFIRSNSKRAVTNFPKIQASIEHAVRFKTKDTSDVEKEEENLFDIKKPNSTKQETKDYIEKRNKDSSESKDYLDKKEKRNSKELFLKLYDEDGGTELNYKDSPSSSGSRIDYRGERDHSLKKKEKSSFYKDDEAALHSDFNFGEKPDSETDSEEDNLRSGDDSRKRKQKRGGSSALDFSSGDGGADESDDEPDDTSEEPSLSYKKKKAKHRFDSDSDLDDTDSDLPKQKKAESKSKNKKKRKKPKKNKKKRKIQEDEAISLKPKRRSHVGEETPDSFEKQEQDDTGETEETRDRDDATRSQKERKPSSKSQSLEFGLGKSFADKGEAPKGTFTDTEKTLTAEEKQKTTELLDRYEKETEEGEKETKLFRIIKDNQYRIGVIDESVKSRCPITLWIKGKALKIEARLNQYSPKDGIIEIKPYPDQSLLEFIDESQEKDISRVFFNFSLYRGSFFFWAPLDQLRYSNGCLKIEDPPTLYQVQRRHYFRLPCFPDRKEYVALEEFGDSRMMDISSGGVSFWIGKDKLSQTKLSAFIENARIDLEGMEIATHLNIVWMQDKDLSGRSGTVFGARFTDLPGEQADWIHDFVISKSAGYVLEYWGGPPLLEDLED